MDRESEATLDDPVVRVRGLPFSSREEDVVNFFSDVPVKDGKDGVTFTFGRDGRVSGEAYVLFESVEDARKALTYHKKYMGKRYLEVFPTTMKEYNFMTGRGTTLDDYVLRLRGLPYDVDKQDIATFFEGCEIAPNGIGLLLDTMGRSTGEAFVQFTSQEMLDRARAKHMQKIGHRYIEMFRSNMLEANTAIRRQMEINESRMYGDAFGDGRGMMGPGFFSGGGRPGPYQRPGDMSYDSSRIRGNVKMFMGGGGRGERSHFGEDWRSTTGHSVHLRGLPFNTGETDIFSFFSPLIPVHVEIHCSQTNGRPTGEADVDFASHEEAKEAMQKDRERIGSRYIELFLNSSPGYDANGRGRMSFGAGDKKGFPQAGAMRGDQSMYPDGSAAAGFGDGRMDPAFMASQPPRPGYYPGDPAASGYYESMYGMAPPQGYYMRNAAPMGRGMGGRYY